MSKTRKLSRKRLTRGLRSLTDTIAKMDKALTSADYDLDRRIAAQGKAIQDIDRRLRRCSYQPFEQPNKLDPCEDTSVESSGPEGFNHKQFEQEEKIA